MAQSTVTISSVFAGNGIAGTMCDGPVSTSYVKYPYGVVLDTTRDILYIADYGHKRIRALNIQTNIMSTVFGSGRIGYQGSPPYDGTPAKLAIDSSRNILYFSERGNCVVRKLNITSGVATLVAGTCDDNLMKMLANYDQ